MLPFSKREFIPRHHDRPIGQLTAFAAGLFFLLAGLPASLRAEERATICGRARSHPIGTLGGKEFVVSDAARALGFGVASDASTRRPDADRPGSPDPARSRHGAGPRRPPHHPDLPAGANRRRCAVRPGGLLRKSPLSARRRRRHLRRRKARLDAHGGRAAAPLDRGRGRARRADDPGRAAALGGREDGDRAVGARLRGPVRRHEDRSALARQEVRRSPRGRRSLLRRHRDGRVSRGEPDGARVPAHWAGPPRHRDRPQGPAAARRAASSPPRPFRGHPAPLTIVVDPGHGGTETGAIGPGGLQEKEATLHIARRLAATLPKVLSCRTVLTRDTDVLIPLDDRASIANHEKADLFLSVHANSSRAASAKGSETYYLSLEASDKIAQEVAKEENQAGRAGAGAGRRERQPRSRLHPVGPRPERAPQGIERARRGDPGRAERRLGHGESGHQAGAVPRPRRRDDAGGPRRVRVHLERRGREEAEGPGVPAGRRRRGGRAVLRFFTKRIPRPSARRPTPAPTP